jgi:hypothetical protein
MSWDEFAGRDSTPKSSVGKLVAAEPFDGLGTGQSVTGRMLYAPDNDNHAAGQLARRPIDGPAGKVSQSSAQ